MLGWYLPKHTHAHINMHSSHWATGPHRKKEVHPAQTLCIIRVAQIGTRAYAILEMSPRVYPYRFIFSSHPLPPSTWYDLRVKPDAREPPPEVAKAASLIMHSSLLSTNFYHIQSSFFCSTDIPLSFIQRSFHMRKYDRLWNKILHLHSCLHYNMKLCIHDYFRFSYNNKVWIIMDVLLTFHF